MFQFHSGSIKSAMRSCASRKVSGFNSIVVRLKAGMVEVKVNGVLVFQFHSGSIKRKVLLVERSKLYPCFNSIVVRLKAHYYSCYRRSPSAFQFHSGSIKRNRPTETQKLTNSVSIP